MAFTEDVNQLSEVLKALKIDTPAQMLLLSEVSLAMKEFLNGIYYVMSQADGLKQEEALAIIIAMLTTHTMAYSVQREHIIQGLPPSDYLKDFPVKDAKL